MRKRRFLLATVSTLVIVLASCGSPQVGQQPQASKTPTETSGAGEASGTSGAGNANNSGSSSGSPGNADTQTAQAVSNYVVNYNNNQNIKVDNSQTNIVNQTNNTAIAEVHYTEAGKLMVAHLELAKDANGNYTVVRLIDQDTQPTTTTTTQPKQSTNPTTAPATPCTGQSGNVLYQADWSSGMNGWAGSSDWKHVDNTVVSDGTPGHPTSEERLLAPCQPPTQDYALEAKIQLINTQCGATYKEFGLVAREADQGAILGGIDCDEAKLAVVQNSNYLTFSGNTIATGSFSPGTGWHVYRLEVKGNQIRLLADGTPILEKADNHDLSGSKVGMFSVGAQINVQSFKIEKL